MDTILLTLVLAAAGMAGYTLGIRHACRELTIQRRECPVVPDRRKPLKQGA